MERVDKILAGMGLGSRKEIKALIPALAQYAKAWFGTEE